MYTNIDIMMMIRQEKIKEMLHEAENQRLIREAYRENDRVRQPILHLFLVRFAGIMTNTGNTFIQVGAWLRTRYNCSQPQFACEENN